MADHVEIAFVSPPGGSIFMRDILLAVQRAVDDLSLDGVSTRAHTGWISDVSGPGVVPVVVPHEYRAYAPAEAVADLEGSIGFGVEHPGTLTFEKSLEASCALGGGTEIGAASLRELRSCGLDAELFELGYTDAWKVPDAPERDIDVVYLGTADTRRLGILGRSARDLADLRTELLIPPHEPMTRNRPDFLMAPDKWELLARSKVLINLHREEKASLEIVRVLEAIINGCVVVTEPCDDYGPFTPGEHLLVAGPSDIGKVAASAARDGDLLARIRAAAIRAAKAGNLMEDSARRLVALAGRVAHSSANQVRPSAKLTPRSYVETPWVYTVPGEQPWEVADAVVLKDVADLLCELSDDARAAVTPPAALGTPTVTVDALCGRLYTEGRAAPLPPSRVPVRHVVPTYGDMGRANAHLVDLPKHLTRGAVRNALLRHVTAPYILILNPGDELLGNTLDRWVAALDADPALAVATSMAVLPQGDMTNVLIPEEKRLEARKYRGSGYLVRRAILEELGGFTEDPFLESAIDHDFWLRIVRGGHPVWMDRRIGVQLAKAPRRVSAERFDPERAARARARRFGAAR